MRVRHEEGEIFRLSVNDINIAAKTSKKIQDVKQVVKKAFKMKASSEAKFIFRDGHIMIRTRKTLLIKQTAFINKVVKQFDL